MAKSQSFLNKAYHKLRNHFFIINIYFLFQRKTSFSIYHFLSTTIPISLTLKQCYSMRSFEYFMSFSRSMPDKLPVIYREKLPSYKLEKEDIRPTNLMFPQYISTQSASNHIKNKNNLVDQKSESSDVKKLRKYIEDTKIQIQNTLLITEVTQGTRLKQTQIKKCCINWKYGYGKLFLWALTRNQQIIKEIQWHIQVFWRIDSIHYNRNCKYCNKKKGGDFDDSICLENNIYLLFSIIFFLLFELYYYQLKFQKAKDLKNLLKELKVFVEDNKNLNYLHDQLGEFKINYDSELSDFEN